MSVLYTPKGRAREYAPLAVNHYVGCTHGCQYCYVPTIPPYKFAEGGRSRFHEDGLPRKGILASLENDCRRAPGNGERVLLSFTTDPYQPDDAEYRVTRDVIAILHAYGYNVQVLTKGGTRALVDLDLFGPGDAYAATMTFLDDESSARWEPNAAMPQDRMAALQAFHEAGVQTWVSLEPVLDPAAALGIIEETHQYVDLYKIGRLNHHPLGDRIDWSSFGQNAVALCERLGKAYYVKHDLKAAMLPGSLGPRHVTVKQIESAERPAARRAVPMQAALL